MSGIFIVFVLTFEAVFAFDGSSMAHRVFSTIDEYDPKKDDWDLYESKFDFYLQANEVKYEKVKRAMLLAGIGMVSLSYVRDLNLPRPLNNDSVTYKKLVEQLRAHYGKKSTSLAARNEFAKIRQKDGSQSTSLPPRYVLPRCSVSSQVISICDYETSW